MKRYDEYKQTGTPWIGEIPSHWEDSRLKYIGEYINGYAFKPEDWSSEGLPIIRIQDLTESNSNPNYFKGTINEKYLIKDGDILVSWAATLAAFKWNRGDAWLNQHIFKAIPNLNINYDFFFWILRIAMKNMKNGEEHGIMMEHVTSDLFGNFPIPIPPLREQEAIAAYLDKKCGSIDTVISTQERRIALLEELKQSVITEAVTHGINPDTKLRPSGIDWIGNIPEHWEVMPLKYAANKKGCCFIDGDWIESKDIVEEGIKYITTGNIGVLYYKEQGSGYISEKTFMSLACTEVFEGDILISRLNEPIGRSCIIPNLGNRVVTSVDNVIFRPDTDYYNKKFIVYYLNCNKFTEHANLIARGATMHRISRSMLGHQKMLVPPLSEQEEIVEYIDRKIKPIDASIAKAKREIDLLKELKQSVITEAVTGKIKIF